MKPHILLLLFFLVSSVGFAQSSDDGLYYSIDGKGWKTEKERDDREADMEADIIDDMIGILTKDNSKADLCGAIKDSQTLALHEVKKLRRSDREVREKLTPKVLALLENQGIDIQSHKAVDNEVFCLLELAQLVDVYIRQYCFYSEWVQAMMKGEEYSEPFADEVDNNTATVAKNIKTANEKLSVKMKLIEETINQPQVETESVELTARNEMLYYSLDGLSFEIKKEYVDRNTVLRDSLKKELNKLDKSGLVDKKMILALDNTLSTIFSQAEILQNIMDTWQSLKDSDQIHRDIIDLQPDIESDKPSTVYYIPSQTAKKRASSMLEMVDAYSCLCSIYDICISTMVQINEDASVSVNFNEQTNDEGETTLTLFKEYLIFIDQIEAKFEKEK